MTAEMERSVTPALCSFFTFALNTVGTEQGPWKHVSKQLCTGNSFPDSPASSAVSP